MSIALLNRPLFKSDSNLTRVPIKPIKGMEIKFNKDLFDYETVKVKKIKLREVLIDFEKKIRDGEQENLKLSEIITKLREEIVEHRVKIKDIEIDFESKASKAEEIKRKWTVFHNIPDTTYAKYCVLAKELVDKCQKLANLKSDFIVLKKSTEIKLEEKEEELNNNKNKISNLKINKSKVVEFYRKSNLFGFITSFESIPVNTEANAIYVIMKILQAKPNGEVIGNNTLSLVKEGKDNLWLVIEDDKTRNLTSWELNQLERNLKDLKNGTNLYQDRAEFPYQG